MSASRRLSDPYQRLVPFCAAFCTVIATPTHQRSARSDTKTRSSRTSSPRNTWASLSRPALLRHPLRHAGHTRLRLCTGDGLQTITVTRSDNEHWPRARKIEWGEQWPWPLFLVMISPYTSTAYVVTGYKGNGQRYISSMLAGFTGCLGFLPAGRKKSKGSVARNMIPKSQARSL